MEGKHLIALLASEGYIDLNLEVFRVEFIEADKHQLGRLRWKGDLSGACYLFGILQAFFFISFRFLLIFRLPPRGMVYYARGEYQKAEPALREALDICLKEFVDPDTLPTLAVRSRLAQLLSARGDYEEAKAEAERIVKTLEQTKLSSRSSIAQALNALGLVFTRTGQNVRAESHRREALNIGGRFLIKDGSLLAETKGALGECLMAQKRYAEAEPFLMESYESFKANQVAHSFRIKESRLRLARLYRDWGKPEQAGKFV